MYQTCYEHSKLIELIPQLNLVESYRNVVPKTIFYHVSPIMQVFSISC